MNLRPRNFSFFALLALTAAVLILSSSYALAQETEEGAGNAEVLAAPSTIDWQGLYAGIHVGYGWGDAETTIDALPTPEQFINLAQTKMNPHPSGVIGGGQLGYNWQKNNFVFGIETDFSGSGMSKSSTYDSITQNTGASWNGTTTTHQDTDWFGTLRLRAGLTPCNKFLIYGTGGMAYGRVNYSANADFKPQGTIEYPTSFSKTKVGWTVGGGVEYALTSNWSIKTEYLYYDLGSESKTADPSPANPPFQVKYEWETNAHTVNLGLNYRF